MTKNTLKVTEILDLTRLSIDSIFECSAISLTLNKIKYCIICLYRIPNLSRSDTNIFLSKLEESANIIFSKYPNSRVLYCGDFNIDFLCKTNNTTDLLDLFHSYCLYPAFNEPTHFQNNSSSAIDYMLLNFHDIILEKNLLNTGLSDHVGQKIVFEVFTPDNKHLYTFRSLSRKNILKFKMYLKSESWQSVFNSTTIDDKYEIFNNILHSYYDLSFNFVTKNLDIKNKDWITTGIKISSIRLKELFVYQKNNIIEKEHYKRYKKIYNKVIRQAKKMYLDNLIINSANKSRTVWKVINGAVKNVATDKTNSDMEIRGKLITDKKIISNEFNNFFINLPKSLVTPQNMTNNINNTIRTPTIDKSIQLEPVTISEVIDTINNLKNSKATGPDDFSIKIIKQCANELAKPLCHLVNECFNNGKFPNLLKISKIIPLPKKGDGNLLNNYRPIALLSVFSKIFEKLLSKRIVFFLESNELYSPNQHGFRDNRSTISALTDILHFIYRNLDEGKKVMAIFIDLSKAFDCVNHDILLNNIEHYGLRGNCKNLLSSYLENRKQFVSYFGECSEELPVDIGVPQGSVLGPLLFLLYINELDSTLSIFSSIFADDITILSGVNNLEILISELNSNLFSLNQYFIGKNLVMNQEKTFSMQFHPVGANYLSSPLLKLNGKSVQQVTTFKILGIHIDFSLNWKAHVNFIFNKCASNCFALKRLRQIASSTTVKIFYYSNMESRFRYGIIFWGNSTSSNRVFVLQKRAIRCMFGLNFRDSCKRIFIEQKILTLPCLYILEILKFVKKNSSKFNHLNEYHNYSTRHGLNLQHGIHRLELYKSNPYYIGSVLYNKLSSDLKNIASVKRFVTTVKKYLVSKAFYSVDEYLIS